MKIALMQVQSATGDLAFNIERHLTALSVFAPGEVDLAVFPELSLTGYAPEIAGTMVLEPEDSRLDPFQYAAERSAASILVGAPTRAASRPFVSLIAFSPRHPRTAIHKTYLHEDELPYFSAPRTGVHVLGGPVRVALAICYEISVDAHVARAAEQGMDVYLASVAKTASGIEHASIRLGHKAREFAVHALAANCVGVCEGKPAGGRSFAIDTRGAIVGELNADEEAALVYDTATATAVRAAVP